MCCLSFGAARFYLSEVEIFDLLREEKVEELLLTFCLLVVTIVMSKKGLQLVSLMQEGYVFKPRLEHNGCMIDLLYRFGRLREAKDVID